VGINVKISDIGLDEVEVIEILVKEGQRIVEEQGLITVEGQKASMEIPSNYTGIVKEIKVKVGDKVKKDSLILILEKDTVNDVNQKLTKESENKMAVNQENMSTKSTLDKLVNKKDSKIFVHASPLVRRLSHQLNIDLQKIRGSGIKNRILRKDIDNYLNQGNINRDKKDMTIAMTKDKHSLNNMSDKFGEIKTVNLSHIQRTSAINLYKNWINIPHVTQFDKSDVTDLDNFRKKLNSDLLNSKKNIKLTLLVFVVKVIVIALRKFPIFNSTLSDKNSTLILRNYFNIGIAVNTDRGLFVPVIKDVDKKNIYDISTELVQFSQKAREGKLSFKDIEGGCFTISNLGGLGGTNFTPIINAPEVAILGLSKCLIEPIWKVDKFIPRLMLPLSLSYDHRVINGADAVNFVNFISENLEDIRLLAVN